MADDHVYQKLVQEAVKACKGDMDCVKRYIDEQMEAMSEADRQAIRREIERVLGFRAPDSPTYKDN